MGAWDVVEKAAGKIAGGVEKGAKAVKSTFEGAPSWVPFVWPMQAAYSAYDMYKGLTAEAPEAPKAPDWEALLASMQGAGIDPRKRRAPPGVIFAGRNYHWTGTVGTPSLKEKGGV